MLTIAKSRKILDVLEDAGLISGYEVHDDGKDEKPGERYWTEVFIDETAAAGVMGDDKRDVMQRTVFETLTVVLLEHEKDEAEKIAADQPGQ